jgi:flagellar operon protein
MERINNYNSPSIDQVAGQLLSQNISNTAQNNEISFEEVLNKTRSIAEILTENKSSELKFSKHADSRLAERNINLSDEQMERLKEGANRAGAKGIKESLVILDKYSFIVNTKNNTVITAMDQDYEDENIYTNIDGAVII